MKVPSNWIKVKFSDIVENVTDRIDKPSESGLKDYIGLDELDTDQIRIKRFASTSDVDATKFLCKKGDIIFGKRNAYLRKVAVCDRAAVVSAHSMIFRPKGDLIDPDFLPCLLQSSTFWRTAHAISEGSMSPTIKWKILSKQEFFILPIKEQKKIAGILWAIEDNIEKTEKLIEINEKLKKGLLNELLTKGIGHKKFKKTEIGEIPEEWDLVKLEDVSTQITDGTHKTPKYTMNGIPFLSTTNVIPFKKGFDFSSYRKFISNDEHEELIKRCKPEKGDILISKCGTIGRTKIIDVNYQFSIFVGLALVKIDHSKIFDKYLEQLLNSDLIQEQMRILSPGSTRNTLAINAIEKIQVTLPNLNEQKRISKILEKFDMQTQTYEYHLIRLNLLKKKLTDELLTGKIRLGGKYV
tara:strand:- start:7714 stop:8943 length:1230 start_codon:yes stop_codon:yes gene_type:complete